MSDRLGFFARANAAAAADFDADGDVDLVFGDEGALVFLINDGTGRFTDEAADRLPDWEAHTLDAKFLDADADGDLDMVVGAAFGGGVRLYGNDGAGRFFLDRVLAASQVDVLDLEILPDGRSVYVASLRSEGLIISLD